ncbi:circadian clock-controlled protein-like [Trichoplusia ni]|uniref:Circadian clock-controlled protein-like n=1 Tax=Trichoplusia ni TaxID=7111 RepID=A0A7E5VZ02_TRINI|nr:circadian clock-controlled protein-like [Trichoplusia ni]
MVFKVACSLFLAIGLAQSAFVPATKCKLEDVPCMTKLFQDITPVFMAGIPEAGIQVMDPMELEKLSFELAGLQFTLSDGRLKGLKNATVDSVKWVEKKKSMTIDFHLDASVKGHYTADGKILILPITGDGQMKLRLKHLAIKAHIDYDVVKGSDDKDHIKLKKYKFEFDVKENGHYHLTNLFNGNKQLSETMLNFLNENWQQIALEFGRPLIDLAVSNVFKNMNKYYEKVALEDYAVL